MGLKYMNNKSVKLYMWIKIYEFVNKKEIKMQTKSKIKLEKQQQQINHPSRPW